MSDIFSVYSRLIFLPFFLSSISKQEKLLPARRLIRSASCQSISHNASVCCVMGKINPDADTLRLAKHS